MERKYLRLSLKKKSNQNTWDSITLVLSYAFPRTRKAALKARKSGIIQSVSRFFHSKMTTKRREGKKRGHFKKPSILFCVPNQGRKKDCYALEKRREREGESTGSPPNCRAEKVAKSLWKRLWIRDKWQTTTLQLKTIIWKAPTSFRKARGQSNGCGFFWSATL